MHCDRRRGIRKPNAQQSLLEGAAIARRAERRRLAGLGQQGDGDARTAGEAGNGRAPQQQVAWVGCQWLMDGYCGRAGDGGGPDAAPERQQNDGAAGTNDTNPPQRPNRAA